MPGCLRLNLAKIKRDIDEDEYEEEDFENKVCLGRPIE